jgi:hypothetical protein
LNYRIGKGTGGGSFQLRSRKFALYGIDFNSPDFIDGYAKVLYDSAPDLFTERISDAFHEPDFNAI